VTAALAVVTDGRPRRTDPGQPEPPASEGRQTHPGSVAHTELALRFSVETARDDAWLAATVISVTPRDFRGPAIDVLDGKAKLLGRIVADQPEPAATVVRHIRDAESTDVDAIITALDGFAAP
jgi:hypothetical protein